MPVSARAQQPDAFEARKSEAHQLYHDGKVKQAIQNLQTLAAEAPSPTARTALHAGLLEICAAGYDWRCVADTVQEMLAAIRADSRLSVLYPEIILHEAKLRHWTRDERYFADLLQTRGAASLLDPTGRPIPAAELQLVMHDYFVRQNNLKSAEESLSAAILGLLLTDANDTYAIARVLIGLLQALVHGQDVARAARLADLAAPFVAQYVPPNSTLNARYRMIVGRIYSFTGNHAATVTHLLEASRLYRQLEIDEAVKLQEMSIANSLGAAALMLDRKPAEAAALHARHPMQPHKESILQRGGFTGLADLYFAVSDVFLGKLNDNRPDRRWKRLFEKEPAWPLPALERAELAAYRNFALGLLTEDTAEAKRRLRLAAGQRIDNFETVLRANFEGYPLPNLIDRIAITTGLSAAMDDGGHDSIELMLRGSDFLSRDLRHALADTAVLLGAQPDEPSRGNAHSYFHLLGAKRGWELDRILRVLAIRGAAPDRDRIIAEHRLATAPLAQLKQSLAAGGRLADTKGFPTLAALRQSLQPGEAFIGYFPHVNGWGKLCVTREAAIFATAQVALPELRRDMRVLEFAVTASHAADEQLDSQFPAAAAMNIGAFLFGGLDACLRPGMQITIALPPGFTNVPLGALLREAPPRKGDGYDLAKARWLIRDVSFTQVVSARHYLATMSAPGRARAPRAFLGIGNPALDAAHTAKVAAAAPGSLKTPNGIAAFRELPETGEELQAVAKLFRTMQSDILVRYLAKESVVRSKPLGEYDVLHFATHGLLADEVAGLTESALMLTPGNVENKADDGLLSASEISWLRLNARLVVLSACNTARYDTTHASQGVQDLQMAFTVAGAPTLVASLWPVESATARDLVTRFFSEWRTEGKGAADALARATRTFLDQATAPYQHPRFWAPFVVMGSGAVQGGEPGTAQ